MALACFGFGLFIFGIAFIISYPFVRRKNKRCSAQTEGTLLEIINKSDSNSGGLVYLYSYCVNGTEYKLKSGPSPQAKNPGDKCTIWYNPAKPKDAQAYPASGKLFLIIGLAAVLLGIILLVLGAGLSGR